jgi:TrmH family RNA methyltransferase
VTSAQPHFVSSPGNALLKELRRLSHDSTAHRRLGRVWLEGDHLCRAAVGRGVEPVLAVFSESSWSSAVPELTRHSGKNVVIADTLFAGLSGLESPARMGFVIALPPAAVLRPDTASVILDRVQDAGNVGAILRCAAAFGFRQILAMKGTAALWSPKVLRSGMGAHFGLQLIESVELALLDGLSVPILTTSSHLGEFLHVLRLPWPCAWAFGHEGQGISEELAGRARMAVRIVQPGGEESLNVASAAAICLHASAAANSR